MKALVLALALAGWLGGPVFSATVTVHISNFTFNPAKVTIKPGDSVLWQNDDDIPHSIIENARKFHSTPLDTGDTFSRTFSGPGEIDYFCGFHAMMQGKIIVAQLDEVGQRPGVARDDPEATV